ncbi:MAG TPA: winged helix DNA-binding domain-containing protein [Gemmatimonadaceae bacterium]
MPSIDVCGQRLAGQHLINQKLQRASEVVQLLGAVQAQDYAPAKWALAQRTRGVTDAEVEKEISDGAILRTHVLRPTWHFVVPADIRWMLELTAPRVRALLAHYDRKLELDAAVLRRSRAVFTKVLRDGKQLTRTELALALTKSGIRADGTQRLAHLVMHSELDGLICSGPRRGKQFTYALLEERVPPAKKLSRDEALVELARRYFTTRGPATTDDFAWWSGLTKTDAKHGAEAQSKLEQTIIGDRNYWFQPFPLPGKSSSPIARLLPNYDEYFIGLKDRSAIQTKLDMADVEGTLSYLRGHIATVDGQIIGGWDRTLKGKSAIVTVRPMTFLGDAARAAIAREVDRFAKFLQLPARLEVVGAYLKQPRKAEG